MAYQRKTQDRFKFTAKHLRRRRALMGQRMRERELDILWLHDVKGLTFRAIGARYGFTRSNADKIYHLAVLKMFNPRHQAIWAEHRQR